MGIHMLSEEAIKEFQILYYLKFGEKISMEEVERMGEHLLRMYKIVFKPKEQ